MSSEETVAQVLLADRNVQILTWENGGTWKNVSNNAGIICAESLQTDGLDGLMDVVQAEDIELCRTFVNRIKEGLVGMPDRTLVKEDRLEIPLHLKTIEGANCYCNIECHFLKDAKGLIEKIVMEIRKLTPEEIYRLDLARNITNDKNPAYFAKGAGEVIAKHPEWQYAVIQFDVAKFKLINEQFGEAAGDEILSYFIHTLKLVCNEYQIYARLSADVFMIVTPYETIEDIYQFIDVLDKNLLGYKAISYTLVYGVCLVTDIQRGLRKFGDGAALARQSIKGNALNHIAFYEEKMTENVRIRKFVEDNMERALEKHEFVMYLQPKYSISEEKMVGAEALVRWIHPEKGIIPPLEFIPLFEQNGFVVKMDQYIWEEACKTIRKWMDEGLEPLPISVNVSRRHLKDLSFVEVLNTLTKRYQIPRKYLEIEITETIEEDGIFDSITRLKESGYTLLMDDFGSGYSSLNMLKDTQFDVIKIDRGFLQNFIGSVRGQKIVEHTIKMTKAIGLDMVAEGVETKEQAHFLSDCGCDTAQGFYYAKPMPLEDFNAKRRLMH